MIIYFLNKYNLSLKLLQCNKKISSNILYIKLIKKFIDIKPIIDPNEVATVIKWLNRVKPEGAILTFLPGWREIIKVKDILEKSQNPNDYMIFPVHSRYVIIPL